MKFSLMGVNIYFLLFYIHKFCMKKSFWGPKMHFSFFDFYHKISYGENDFVIQIIWQYFLQLHVSDQIPPVATPWCIFHLNFFHETFLTLWDRNFESVPRNIWAKICFAYTPNKIPKYWESWKIIALHWLGLKLLVWSVTDENI